MSVLRGVQQDTPPRVRLTRDDLSHTLRFAETALPGGVAGPFLEPWPLQRGLPVSSRGRGDTPSGWRSWTERGNTPTASCSPPPHAPGRACSAAAPISRRGGARILSPLGS